MASLRTPCCQIGSELASAEEQAPGWAHLVALVPVDLPASARAYGAFQRARGVRAATTLRRLVLLYAQADWSLRLVAGGAALHGWGTRSHAALLARVRRTEAWLQALVGPACPAGGTPAARVRLLDASAVRRPGSTGTDWRLHLSLDLATNTWTGLAVTLVRAGETLTRHALAPGAIAVADAGYCHPAGLAQVHAAGAESVVRWAEQTLPLPTPSGAPLALAAWLRALPAGGVAEQAVQARPAAGPLALRLIALRLPPEAADRARAGVRRPAQKTGRTPSARSLERAGCVLLVTTLPAAWSAAAVLALYRLRWQIELTFQRLKSLWAFDAVRARQPALGTVDRLGTLLRALLAQRAAQPLPADTAGWFLRAERPLSAWRWEPLWREVVRQAVVGPAAPAQARERGRRLERYLCDAPRTRRQQAATARAALAAADRAAALPLELLRAVA